jgi:hypothetical protein
MSVMLLVMVSKGHFAYKAKNIHREGAKSENEI